MVSKSALRFRAATYFVRTDVGQRYLLLRGRTPLVLLLRADDVACEHGAFVELACGRRFEVGALFETGHLTLSHVPRFVTELTNVCGCWCHGARHSIHAVVDCSTNLGGSTTVVGVNDWALQSFLQISVRLDRVVVEERGAVVYTGIAEN